MDDILNEWKDFITNRFDADKEIISEYIKKHDDPRNLVRVYEFQKALTNLNQAINNFNV